MAKAIILTSEGKAKLEKELHDLVSNERLEIAEKIKTARSYGDLSENSEYDEAKNEQAMVEARIAKLEATLKNVVVVDDVNNNDAVVGLGSTVTILDIEYDEELEYSIVSSIEANPTVNKISDDSPLGAALMGRAVDDEVEVEAPIGVLKYKILKITK